MGATLPAVGFGRGPRLQAEKDRSRPACAGDCAGDLRQRAIARLLPNKAIIAHQNLMGAPLPFAQQPRAGLAAGVARPHRPPPPADPLPPVSPPPPPLPL